MTFVIIMDCIVYDVGFFQVLYFDCMIISVCFLLQVLYSDYIIIN